MSEQKFNNYVFKTLTSDVIQTLEDKKGLEIAYTNAKLDNHGDTWVCCIIQKDESVKISGKPTWKECKIIWVIGRKEIFVTTRPGIQIGLEDPKLSQKIEKAIKKGKWDRHTTKPPIRAGKSRARR